MLAKINKYISICSAHMVHSCWFQRCARRTAVLVAVVQLEVATEVCGSHAEKTFILDDPTQFPQYIVRELMCLLYLTA